MTTDRAPEPTGSGDDPAAAIRSEIEALDERPVTEHVEVFERANRVIASELSALDEV
ncbi:MAG: hypothetical protein WD638_01895 [Nitriliruptoraceae bacterium]